MAGIPKAKITGATANGISGPSAAYSEGDIVATDVSAPGSSFSVPAFLTPIETACHFAILSSPIKNFALSTGPFFNDTHSVAQFKCENVPSRPGYCW
jgi:hypothetical protein